MTSGLRVLVASVFCFSGDPPAGDGNGYVPDLLPLVDPPTSELAPVVERYATDRAALLRRHDAEPSASRGEALRDFYRSWQERLAALPFDAWGPEGRIDAVLLGDELDYELGLLEREARLSEETRPLLPFAEAIVALQENRRRLDPVEPAEAAAALDRLQREIAGIREKVEAGVKPEAGEGALRPSRTTAFRAARRLDDLRRTLEGWYRAYAGYDPLFTWWAKAPYAKVEEAIGAYRKVLREKIVGVREGEDEPIVGDPIGREGLDLDLRHERIAYAPEALLAIAERELAWCEAEARKAAAEMGCGEDWKAALERVKARHVEPGRQPTLIRDLAREAIAFVEARALVTVPPLARDVWRIEMMTPEAQKESPFFLGGEVIRVSFPTDGMAHEDKLMSLRGNNEHFARATVHHELIPGHHLQAFYGARYNTHRRSFGTPFWTEGWAFYWEMLLWDLGFPRSPEDRIGMLFWRMHRAARILFSLGFHLGRMTPEQCVDFLVERVGHERANATAEVRRSFGGGYSPLYQCAYMIGGLQFRALRRELVESGRMSDRAFHDAVLRAHSMPVEMVRASLAGTSLPRGAEPSWRFDGEPAGAARGPR